MKKTIFLFVILFSLWGQGGFAQTIRRCNNDPNIPLGLNMYRTLQDAHDAAAANDIIYVEPSYGGVSYGNLTCTKTLRIIGNGFWQDLNTSINPTWDYRTSIVGTISIESGAGTVLQGLYMAGNAITIKAQNVTVTRCYVALIDLQRNNASQNASGAIISDNIGNYAGYNTFVVQCEGYSTYNATTCSYTAYQVQNITIKNNIMIAFTGSGIYANSYLNSGGTCTISPTQVPHTSNATLSNNIMAYNSTGFPIYGCQSCTIYSNIFRNTSTNGMLKNCPSYVASYNVCGTNPCGFGSNNVDSANEALLFVGGTTLNYDKDFQLTGFSPAKGAGLGGVDAGAFGTNNPYRLSGLAPVPQINAYTQNASSGVYTATTPMNITISVRGNN